MAVCLHYEKTRHFHIRLAGFMNLNFFVRDKMANTNAKTPCFHHSVNEPLVSFSQMGLLSLFLFILIFSMNKRDNFFATNLGENVHPVYSAGIQTHGLQNMSLLP